MSMIPVLHRSFQKLETSKASIVQSVSTWTPAALIFRESETAWSVTEVVDHIVKVEAGFLHTVRRQIGDPQPITLQDRYGNLLVNAVMRSRMRVKVPQEAKMVLPSSDCDVQSALLSWQRARDGWRDLLETAAPAALQGGVFRHPRAGWMTLPATLTFLRLHHEHHRAQIARIRASLLSS